MANRPHVLLIVTDHWPAALLGCAGHPAIQTPTLDALASSGLWAKQLFYEYSANVPFLLIGADSASSRIERGVDHRLVGLADVMPTLLELAGVDVPASVEGRSVVTADPRPRLYGEMGDDVYASRMLHDGRHKLIWYPAGNRRQLFDLQADPSELTDLGDAAESAAVRRRLEACLVEQLYGGDLEWVRDGELVGVPDRAYRPGGDKDLGSQRGGHWPPPPRTDMQQIRWLTGSA